MGFIASIFAACNKSAKMFSSLAGTILCWRGQTREGKKRSFFPVMWLMSGWTSVIYTRPLPEYNIFLQFLWESPKHSYMTESEITPSERLNYMLGKLQPCTSHDTVLLLKNCLFFTSDNCNPVAAKPFQWVYVACLGYTLNTSNSTCSKIKALHFISQMKASKLWQSWADINSPCSILPLSFLGGHEMSVFSCLSTVTQTY